MNHDKRQHCVSVRMNSDELDRLNMLRGRVRRGTYLRLLFNDSLPASVPEVNQQAYSELARAASNLNQLAHHLNIGGHVDMQEVLDALGNFRLRLIGVES